MKKTSIIIVLALISSFWVNHADAQINYGIKAGYTGYKLTGSDVYGGMNYVYNPAFGGSFGIKFKTDFQLVAEINYVTKGVHQLFTTQQTIHSFEFDTVPVKTLDYKKYNNTLKTTYVDLPILLKKSFSFKGGVWPYDRKIGKVDFDLILGGYFGYRIGGSASLSTMWKQDITKKNITTPGTEIKYDTTGFYIGQKVKITSVDTTYPKELFTNYVPTSKPNASKDLSSFDAGIIAGLGMSVEVNDRSKISLEFRYSMGLLTVDKTYFNNVEYLFTPGAGAILIGTESFAMTTRRTKMDVKNNGIGLFLGYTIYVQ